MTGGGGGVRSWLLVCHGPDDGVRQQLHKRLRREHHSHVDRFFNQVLIAVVFLSLHWVDRR